MPNEKSAARQIQETVEAYISGDVKEQIVPCMFRFLNPDQPDLHLNLPASVVYAILDPDVPDTFIKVAPDMAVAKGRHVHTNSIRELLYFAELPPLEQSEVKPVQTKRGG